MSWYSIFTDYSYLEETGAKYSCTSSIFEGLSLLAALLMTVWLIRMVIKLFVKERDGSSFSLGCRGRRNEQYSSRWKQWFQACVQLIQQNYHILGYHQLNHQHQLRFWALLSAIFMMCCKIYYTATDHQCPWLPDERKSRFTIATVYILFHGCFLLFHALAIFDRYSRVFMILPTSITAKLIATIKLFLVLLLLLFLSFETYLKIIWTDYHARDKSLQVGAGLCELIFGSTVVLVELCLDLRMQLLIIHDRMSHPAQESIPRSSSYKDSLMTSHQEHIVTHTNMSASVDFLASNGASGQEMAQENPFHVDARSGTTWNPSSSEQVPIIYSTLHSLKRRILMSYIALVLFDGFIIYLYAVQYYDMLQYHIQRAVELVITTLISLHVCLSFYLLDLFIVHIRHAAS